jgi:hypothetical protein
MGGATSGGQGGGNTTGLCLRGFIGMVGASMIGRILGSRV